MIIVAPQSSFTRPANTTAYAVGDLLSDNTTAGSVTPLKFSMNGLGRSGMVRRVRMHKTTNTTMAATFNLHLFDAPPTVTNGDNAAFAVASNLSSWLGKVAIDMTSGALAGASAGCSHVSAAVAIGVCKPTGGGVVYGLLEVAGIYAPGSAEVFTVSLEIEG